MKFSHKAKQLGLEYYEVNLGMFDYQVKLVFGTEAQAVALVNWYYDDPGKYYYVDGASPKGQLFHNDRRYAPIIWLPHRPATVAEHATFAHECCHAVLRMFGWAGIPLCIDNEEVFAHGLSFLIEEFYRKMG